MAIRKYPLDDLVQLSTVVYLPGASETLKEYGSTTTSLLVAAAAAHRFLVLELPSMTSHQGI